ncbi:DUF5916 domain-containing protein [Spongiimicrobium sp. 2-473A-2-J]|uniref:carbohydrate binding family 9 domain-containing protein n=1 Tax=Eudoraea algarum TaxID=3417568 RepID=UPI003D366AD8
MIRKYLLVFFIPLLSNAQQIENRLFHIKKVQVEEIKLDARLDETFWSQADQVPLAFETDPGNNTKAEVATTLRLAYNSEYLYFSFEAKDSNTKAIRAIINDRDKLDDNDFVSLFIDPFNDSRRAFFFTVNPFGVQQDGIFDEQVGDGDLSWDAIWKSSGRITGDGYIVEGAIPFKSLRFPASEKVQTWRFFGFRTYPRSLKKSFHSMPIDQGNNCLLCQANLMTGLQGIRPGVNLEFTPTFTLNRFDEREDFPEGSLTEGQIASNLGLDARWGITSDLTLNLAFNPDFSQVEADAAQLDVNNRFALQFPEKRPFFLEGADFFNTPLQAFFTRTITDPSYGVKISGKINKNAVGLLLAQDRVNNLILPGFQGSESVSLDQEVTNVIARYRRDIGNNSNIGLLYTGREGGNYFNHVGGLDAFVRPWKPLTLRAQYLHTETKYDSIVVAENNLRSTTFNGNSINFQADFDTRNWEGTFIYESRPSGFRADAGFVPQVDFRRYRAFVERRFWPKETTWYSNVGWNAGGFRRESMDGILDLEGIWTSAYFNGPLQLNYWINPDIIWQRTEGETFKLVRLWTGFDIQPLGNLGINGWINLGPAVDFENTRKTDNLQFRLESDIRIGKHIDMTVNHRFLRLHLSGETIFTANLTQLQAAYNFNPRMFFRVVMQYRHTLRNPELFDDNRVNRIDQSVFAQLLLSYKLNPQSVIFLGYVDNLEGFENTVNVQDISLRQLNQTLFFKIGYAWRP